MTAERSHSTFGACLGEYVKQLRSNNTNSGSSVRSVALPALDGGSQPAAIVRVVTPSNVQHVSILSKAAEPGSTYYYSHHQPSATHTLPPNEQLQLPTEEVQLLARYEQLQSELQHLQQQKLDHDTYLQVLHDYNDQKDIVVQLLGQLAVAENTTVGELYVRFGLETDD